MRNGVSEKNIYILLCYINPALEIMLYDKNIDKNLIKIMIK